jgi:peptidoglycan/LPS O-acetylase OafA/YrhL
VLCADLHPRRPRAAQPLDDLAFFLAGLAYLAADGPYWIEDFQSWNHRADLATKFLAGAVLFHWRPRLDGTAAIASASLALFAFAFGGFWLALPTVFAYVVLYVALGPWRLPDAARYGDLSYGLYIYAWPIKQLILDLGLASTWYGLGALATPLTLAAAFLSWHLVEKVALSYKDRTLPGEARWAAGFDGTVRRLQGWMHPVYASRNPGPPGRGGWPGPLPRP